MNSMKIMKSFLVLCLVTWGIVSAKGADQQSELQLESCVIELVDGTKVEGKLAVQFDMDDYLIVYSPSLATVRSFLKDHVHALTIKGKRHQINAKRELTDEDKQMLGRVKWPDAPPQKGRQPAYTSETWDAPKRLMVWKNPGTSGVLHDPDNWIVVGGTDKKLWQPVDTIDRRDLNVSWLGSDTDILVPAAAKSYQSKFSLRPAGIIKCRHVTVEHKAKFNPSTVPTMRGNLWVARGGFYRSRYTTRLTGEKHTFLLNDQPRLTPGSPGVKPVRSGYIVPMEHGGPGYDGYSVGQYLNIRKANDASVELIGTIMSSDDFQMVSGTLIVAENGQLWPGTRSVQHLRAGTTLRLMSGAEYGKAHNATGSGYGCKYKEGSLDVIVAGRVEVGSPEYPITNDVKFGISFKEPVGFGELKNRLPGAVIVPGAEFVVHTADPEKARLVIGWHERHNAWFESRLEGYKEMPEEIALGICGNLMLENVRFENVAKEGLIMENPSTAERWKNVTFGESCHGTPEELIVKWPDLLRKSLVSDKWSRQAKANK